jgi:hypothetical protein
MVDADFDLPLLWHDDHSELPQPPACQRSNNRTAQLYDQSQPLPNKKPRPKMSSSAGFSHGLMLDKHVPPSMTVQSHFHDGKITLS